MSLQKKYPIQQNSVQCQGTQIDQEQLLADPHIYPTPILKVSQTPLRIPQQDFPWTRHPTSVYTALGVIINAGGNCWLKGYCPITSFYWFFITSAEHISHQSPSHSGLSAGCGVNGWLWCVFRDLLMFSLVQKWIDVSEMIGCIWLVLKRLRPSSGAFVYTSPWAAQVPSNCFRKQVVCNCLVFMYVYECLDMWMSVWQLPCFTLVTQKHLLACCEYICHRCQVDKSVAMTCTSILLSSCLLKCLQKITEINRQLEQAKKGQS